MGMETVFFFVRMWKSYMTSPKEFLSIFLGLGGFFRFVWKYLVLNAVDFFFLGDGCGV